MSEFRHVVEKTMEIIVDEMNVKWWLTGGAGLQAYRDDEINGDIDIGILWEDAEKLDITTLPEGKWLDEHKTSASFKNGEILCHAELIMESDAFLPEIKPGDKFYTQPSIRTPFTFPHECFHELAEIKWRGMLIPLPTLHGKITDYFNWTYGRTWYIPLSPYQYFLYERQIKMNNCEPFPANRKNDVVQRWREKYGAYGREIIY